MMPTQKQLIQQQVAHAVGAGRAVALETVDFNDPNRPRTCLERMEAQGGYPTLAHGGLALLEILSPFVEISKTGA